MRSGADDYLLKDSLARLPAAVANAIEKKLLTERIKTTEELKKSHYKLYEFSQHLENIRDEEKKNISMTIHDQLGQELTRIKLGLDWQLYDSPIIFYHF